MAYLKTEIITYYDRESSYGESVKVRISVNSEGEFYTDCPEKLRSCVDGVTDGKNFYRWNNKKDQLFSSSLERLKSGILQALKALLTPEISTVLVIQYNIESHISFAENAEGKIFPNAFYDGANWPADDRLLYGNHDACRASDGGYSLTIGAEALKKTTYRYGTKENITYETYTDTEAAEQLNAWVCFRLPDDSKEMPYTDDAARFFYNLMLGMAEISKKIQHFAGDDQRLIELIESQQLLLPNTQ